MLNYEVLIVLFSGEQVLIVACVFVGLFLFILEFLLSICACSLELLIGLFTILFGLKATVVFHQRWILLLSRKYDFILFFLR